MIEVTDLVKRYGNHLAVDHLNFAIRDGQIYGLLGPNGAGKTTTMNLLTGYLCANEGSVVINGYDMFRQPEKAKTQIGYLPEVPPLYLDMTVTEYLRFVCELKKFPQLQITDEIRRVSGKTGITDVRERLIRNLSKGYQQRVGIAQALIGSPSIIILDEPTVGLDPLQIIEIRDLIRELGREHTVILSSHILSEVSAVCDEIMIISKGKLVAQDTAENLTRLTAGRKLLHLVVNGDGTQIRERILTMDGVVNCDEKQTDEGSAFSIETDRHTDLREAVFFACAEAGLPILEMFFKSTSLEEVFIELTGREDEKEVENVSGI